MKKPSIYPKFQSTAKSEESNPTYTLGAELFAAQEDVVTVLRDLKHQIQLLKGDQELNIDDLTQDEDSKELLKGYIAFFSDDHTLYEHNIELELANLEAAISLVLARVS